MARKPKPAALRILQGRAGHRPINDSVKLPVDALAAPDFLVGFALEKWNHLEPILRAAGIVTVADADALAGYCSAYGEWRDAETIMRGIENPLSRFLIKEKAGGGRNIKNPLTRCRAEARAEMMKFASELGITPSSRTGVVPVNVARPANKFSGIGRK